MPAYNASKKSTGINIKKKSIRKISHAKTELLWSVYTIVYSEISVFFLWKVYCWLLWEQDCGWDDIFIKSCKWQLSGGQLPYRELLLILVGDISK